MRSGAVVGACDMGGGRTLLNVVHPTDTLLEALETLGIPFTEISEQESAK